MMKIKYKNELSCNFQEKILEKSNTELMNKLGIEIKPTKWWNWWQKRKNKKNAKIQEIINDIHTIGNLILNISAHNNDTINLSLNLMIMETLYTSEIDDILLNKNNSGLEEKIKELEKTQEDYKLIVLNNQNLGLRETNPIVPIIQNCEQEQQLLLNKSVNISDQNWQEAGSSRLDTSIPIRIKETEQHDITTNNPNSVSANVIESQIEKDTEPLIVPDQQHSNKNEPSSNNYEALYENLCL